MRRLLLALLAGLLVVPAPAALAAEPSDAIDDLVSQGYYVERGARPISEQGVQDLIAAARNAGTRLMIVILDADPAGGPVTFGDAVLDDIGDGTVIVLTRSDDVGVASTEYSQAESEAALDAADAAGGSDLAYLTTFTNALVLDRAPVATTAAPGSDGGGGGGGLLILLLVVGGLVLLVVFLVRRSKKKSAERTARDLEVARSEIKAQLDAMANDILDLEVHVGVSESAEAQQHYEQASASYAAATEQLDGAETLLDLEKLADQVALATWQLDAAQALVEGKPVPAKPEPREYGRCFFDPTHRGPFEDAVLETSAGNKAVRVCRTDAEKLRRGETPEPRLVEVGGRSIPAPQAPRSHGGGGFGGLDVLSILVGGMAAGRATSWGRPARRSRYSSGGRSMGSVFGSSRSRSTSSSRSSRSSRTRSSSRSRSSSSRSRTGRRRRR